MDWNPNRQICEECRYAISDYAEYYGGARQYFITDCMKGGMMPDFEEEIDCVDFAEREGKYEY